MIHHLTVRKFWRLPLNRTCLIAGWATGVSKRVSGLVAAITMGLGCTLATAQMPAAASLGSAAGMAANGQASPLPLPAPTAAPEVPGLQRPVMPARPDLGLPDAALRQPATPGMRALPAQPPSQFQKFVQETHGKLLPVFGAELFENPMAYAADSAAPAPADYVLGPGDEVRIQLWGSVDFAGSQTVDRNGQISLPKIGAVQLAGVQVKDLEPALRKQIATVFNNVTVNATLGRLRGMTVYVVGQARQPGTYNLNSLSTLINAIFASGGPSVTGSMRNIQLKRGGQTITTMDLYEFIAKGDKSKDARLQPGDVIMIPPAAARVALLGATDHSAIYEIRQGQTLADLLTLGGGVPTLAAPHKAVLETLNASQPSGPRHVAEIALDAAGLATPLKDADVVNLLPVSPAFSNAVTLQGVVAQPLRHPWRHGMRISDLIPDREALITRDYYQRKNRLVQPLAMRMRTTGGSTGQVSEANVWQNAGVDAPGNAQERALPKTAGVAPWELDSSTADNSLQAGSRIDDRIRNMVDQINWDYAVIERLNKQDLRTELIPFNLARALEGRDQQHNLALQPGDVVTILNSRDLRLPVKNQTRLIRVEGEVAAPGIYKAQPGETLPQLIQRIGGLTPQAYVFGTEFTRETVRRQQQQNLDQLVRRLEEQLKSAASTSVVNLTGERAGQAAAIAQAQQTQMQAQLDKLRSMKSLGRVSLELDPEAAQLPVLSQLPALPLEDGDGIHIPARPAFVAALGSVNNENVIIHRPGKTVGDILMAAGPAEDAELSEAFLLRADGSIVSRRNRSWFSLSSFESTRVMPGDTLVVPAMIDRESRYNFLVRALRDWTQIFSNLGIGAAAIKTLRN